MEKCFIQNLHVKSKHLFYVAKPFFRIYFCLWKSVEKYCRPGRPQMTIKYIAFALHAVNVRLQSRLRIFNIYYVLTATIVTQTPEFYVILTRPLMFSD